MNPKRVHILGIGGTLMGAFALYLKRQNVHVTGTDQNLYPPMGDLLKAADIPVFEGYRAENLSALKPAPELVVIGNVIRRDNPEAQAVLNSGLPYTSLPEFLEKNILVHTKNLVVAGTHGKTTTSSLLAYVLNALQLKPSYFIGGVSHDLLESFSVQSLESSTRTGLFVLEGDEYDTVFWDKVPKFNHYLPDHVILTSVEYDHADIYPDLAAVIRAFQGLLDRIRPGGHLIACTDNNEVRNLLERTQVKYFSYGTQLEFSPQYAAQDISVTEEGTSFDILKAGKKITTLHVQLHGIHNVLNALSVWIECDQLGLDPKKVQKAMADFRGVKRRLEIRGEVKGITVIDDFAHHPTAVKTTLEGVRARFPKKRMVAVFEPRSATSRRKVFQKDYAAAFDSADLIFIAPVYDTLRIEASQRFSSDDLVADLQKRGRKAYLLKEGDEKISQVKSHLAAGDIVMVLSNGGFDGFISKLLQKLTA